MSSNNNLKESMVLYRSAYEAISYLPDEHLQLEAFKGLAEYGFNGVLPDSSNPFVKMIFAQAIPPMRCAKERYEKAVNDGKKGGRPTEVSAEDIMRMKQDGLTNAEIAEKLGLSVKTVEYHVTAYNREHPKNPKNLKGSLMGAEGQEYPKNPKNLTDTVTVTDTVTGNDTENGNGNKNKNISSTASSTASASSSVSVSADELPFDDSCDDFDGEPVFGPYGEENTPPVEKWEEEKAVIDENEFEDDLPF